MKTLIVIFLSLGCAISTSVAKPSGDSGPTADSLAPYIGIYQAKSGAVISIAIFDPGDGENRLLFTELQSGLIRVLTPVSQDAFSAGPGLLVPSPIEMRLTFHRRGNEAESSFVVHKDGAPDDTARKVSGRRQEVVFKNGYIALAGTLITPSNGPARGAVVFLHGSGALNRYSFGPFPDFFVSQGFAVLVYDKRGTGQSKGDLDSSTLKDLAADGKAAVRFLKDSDKVDPEKIGLCGVSQGGFLAAAVSSENPDVAFMVNLYGMYVPVWEQELYRAEAEMRAEQISEPEITQGLVFVKQEFEVAKTGIGWETLAKTIQESKEKKWWPFVTKAASLDELRHYWETLYSYDPSLALETVSCPVLAMFGELDTSTPVPETIKNMREALKVAGNSDFTDKVFSKAGHGLLETDSAATSEIPKAKRLAPGLYETIANWLQKRPVPLRHPQRKRTS